MWQQLSARKKLQYLVACVNMFGNGSDRLCKNYYQYIQWFFNKMKWCQAHPGIFAGCCIYGLTMQFYSYLVFFILKAADVEMEGDAAVSL